MTDWPRNTIYNIKAITDSFPLEFRPKALTIRIIVYIYIYIFEARLLSDAFHFRPTRFVFVIH